MEVLRSWPLVLVAGVLALTCSVATGRKRAEIAWATLLSALACLVTVAVVPFRPRVDVGIDVDAATRIVAWITSAALLAFQSLALRRGRVAAAALAAGCCVAVAPAAMHTTTAP